ncbi:MAG TPA: hypothetical protein VMY37_22165 [Thermoguttaceae bacterium]|nr:hypothetical protein [Thermoguttaceae bacterium]
MTTRIGLLTTLGLLVAIGPAAGQTQPGQPAPPRQPASQQYPAASPEALVPRDPQLVRRDPQSAAAAPFVLTPEQQADLDWVLKRWEEHGGEVKAFECKFTRFDWDPAWRADQPMHIVRGEIKYAAPDKGMFRVDGEIVDFRWSRGEAIGGRLVKGQQAEQWICSGKSLFEYDFQQKQLVEHKLPPELWGQAISNSPLPFVFGAKAGQLKERYFLRVDTLDQAKDQVWLEAHPKRQGDAANFRRATLILTLSTMQPFALETVLPNGTATMVYQFENPKLNVVNLLDPLKVFENNWLHARTPAGWKKVVEEAPPAEARRASTPDRMR